jgi:hypothetical protein
MAIYNRFGRLKVVEPSPTPYGANTSAVVADDVAGSDIVTCVPLSTDWVTVLACTPMPLMGMPGDMLLVSLSPVTTAEPLTSTPFCWIVMALKSGASVKRFFAEPSR